MSEKCVGQLFAVYALMFFASIAKSAGLNISNAPLYVTQPLPPNVILTPVYSAEYNEVSMRLAPWDTAGNCTSNNVQAPCKDRYSVWNIGAPFSRLIGYAFGAGRVVPWPGTYKTDRAGAEVNSIITLYPNDKIASSVGEQLRALDYLPAYPGGANDTDKKQVPTMESYPNASDAGRLTRPDEGKSRYVRSNLNFLYFNKNVAERKGYSPWPNLGRERNFPVYANSTQASTPRYHPINAAGITANLAAPGTHWARQQDPANPTVSGSYVTREVPHYIGQYWKYNGGEVWDYNNYTMKDWSTMEEQEKKDFAHWFTYWRSSDLAARGMMARVVESLGPTGRDLLGKFRLGVFHADRAGKRNVNLVVGNTQDAVLQSLGDIIYSQDTYFTVPVTENIFNQTGGRVATGPVWEPYKTVEYFSTEAPYRDDPRCPGANCPAGAGFQSPVRSCRRNYEIVVTPDYSGLRRYEMSVSSIKEDSGSFDPGSPGPDSPENYDRILGEPYADGFIATWGDVGAYGWNFDLMPGLPDDLLPNTRNSKSSQHLVRYVVGPKNDGRVFRPFDTYDDALQHLKLNDASRWLDPRLATFDQSAPVIDDLWHMALNSRGFFYSGENITDAVEKLLTSFNEIIVNNVSGSSIATSTTSLSAGGLIYLATVENDWKGHLRAYPISKVKNANNKDVLQVNYTAPVWNLSEKISSLAETHRVIATYNGESGVPFRWNQLGATSKTQLNTYRPAGIVLASDIDLYGQRLTNYLRGDGACEDGVSTCTYTDSSGVVQTYSFRRRNLDRNNTAAYSANNTGGRNLLGDIANSSPWLVGTPTAGPSDVDYPGYNAFRVDKKNRASVLYVGANDGMLHAVKASDGTELFAYVPSFVHANLYDLSKASYGHRYYVDGSPFSADVYINNNWKTVLAGGANRGGKGYYLLDISNPMNNTENNPEDWVLWEFQETDLHYTYNLPAAFQSGQLREGQSRQIVRMNDDKWAMIIGNGYPEEANKKACLFIVYLTGPTGANKTWVENTDYRKICVGVGDYSTDENGVGLGTNGLSTPTPYDMNGDGKVDVIYAGDLNGNLWRFNVSATAPTSVVNVTQADGSVTSDTIKNWDVAYEGVPVFVAKNASNVRQPIIAPPELRSLVSGTTYGNLLLFGTGKYIEDSDLANTDVQSFYGVWDRGLSGIGRGNLFAQSFLYQATPTIRYQGAKPVFTYCASGAAVSDCTSDANRLGWYWDMPTSRERLTGKATLIDSVVLFNTFFPATETYSENGVEKTRLDPCKYGGDGWLMGLNALYGYMEDQFPVFDVNQDGVVDASDSLAAGIKVGAVIGGTSFARGIGDTEVGLSSPTNKELGNRDSMAIVHTGVGARSGRVSWFELLD